MFSRLLLSCMIFSAALPVFAEQSADQASPAAIPESAETAKKPSQQQIEQAMLDKQCSKDAVQKEDYDDKSFLPVATSRAGYDLLQPV